MEKSMNVVPLTKCRIIDRFLHKVRDTYANVYKNPKSYCMGFIIFRRADDIL